jgi:hypothetical protein
MTIKQVNPSNNNKRKSLDKTLDNDIVEVNKKQKIEPIDLNKLLSIRRKSCRIIKLIKKTFSYDDFATMHKRQYAVVEAVLQTFYTVRDIIDKYIKIFYQNHVQLLDIDSEFLNNTQDESIKNIKKIAKYWKKINNKYIEILFDQNKIDYTLNIGYCMYKINYDFYKNRCWEFSDYFAEFIKE